MNFQTVKSGQNEGSFSSGTIDFGPKSEGILTTHSSNCLWQLLH